MNQGINGISQYLNLVSDQVLQQYARQAGINAMGNRQQLIQQLATALAGQGFEVALAGRGNQAVGLNTAFGGFNQNFAQQGNQGRSNGNGNGNGNRGRSNRGGSQGGNRGVVGLGQGFIDGRSRPGGNNPAGINQFSPMQQGQSFAQQGNQGSQQGGNRAAQYDLQDLQQLPVFQVGKERAQRNRSPSRSGRSAQQGSQGSDLRTRPGGNNPAGINQYNENDTEFQGSRGRSRSRTDANVGVFTVSPVRTNPLSPTSRKVQQILRNANDTGFQSNQANTLSPVGQGLPTYQQNGNQAVSPGRLGQQTALSPRFMSPLANQQSLGNQALAQQAQTGLVVLPSGRMIGDVSPTARGSMGQTFSPQTLTSQSAGFAQQGNRAMSQQAMSPMRSLQQNFGSRAMSAQNMNGAGAFGSQNFSQQGGNNGSQGFSQQGGNQRGSGGFGGGQSSFGGSGSGQGGSR